MLYFMYKRWHVSYMWQNVKKISGHNKGYTVVEVMVVLAVTSALFVGILGNFVGQQSRTEFATAAREIESKVRDVINDTSTGYYPSSGKQCTAGANGPSFNASNSAQGANSGCLFIGRVFQFGVGPNGDEYRIISVAGLRQNSTGADVSSLAEAKPIAIAPANATPASTDPPDVTEQGTYPGGIKIGKITYDDPGATGGADAIGFFSTFNVNPSGAADVKSGAVGVDVVPLGDGANPYPFQYEMAAIINGIRSTPSIINPKNGTRVCFISARGDQIAILTIGGSGRQLGADMVIQQGSTCP